MLLLEQPLTEFAYDTDPKQSAQSRVRILSMLAANRIPLLAIISPGPASAMWRRRDRASATIPPPW